MNLPTIRGKRSLLLTKHITPNPWNPNVLDEFMTAKLKEGILTFGFTKELVVRELAKDTYEIIDGQHRHGIATELGMVEVPCLNLGKISNAEAKQLCEIFIHLHGTPDVVKEAELIRSLVEDDGIDLTLLEPLLPFTADELTSMYGTLDFDWQQYERVSQKDKDGSSLAAAMAQCDAEGTPEHSTPTEVTPESFIEASQPSFSQSIIPTLQSGPFDLKDGKKAYAIVGLSEKALGIILAAVEKAGGDPVSAMEEICLFYKTNTPTM